MISNRGGRAPCAEGMLVDAEQVESSTSTRIATDTVEHLTPPRSSQANLESRPDGPISDVILTRSMVMDYLGIATTQLYRLQRLDKDFPPPIRIGRSPRWLANELRAYVELLKQRRT